MDGGIKFLDLTEKGIADAIKFLTDRTVRSYEKTEKGNPIKYKYVKYDKKYKCITVNGHYHIEINRMNTAGEALDWIHQLHEKTWFTDEMMREFIDIIFKIVPTNMWACGGHLANRNLTNKINK